MNLLIVFLALATSPGAFSLYYTGIKEVFQPPTKLHKNSYFGYSITYDGFNKKLIISAPTENNIGEVYICNIENGTCTPIVKNVTRASSMYTHDYWFGATVKAGPDFVLMCAPRHIELTDRHIFDKEIYGTYGKCYTYANSVINKIPSIAESEKNRDSGVYQTYYIEKTMDSFGWSIDVALDNSTIVGGPGMFHGRAMIYKRYNEVPRLIRTSRLTAEFNFGYAVASGMFLNNALSYAVGSPYGMGGYGEVAFYRDVRFQRKIAPDSNSQLGSMFGAVLCAARLYGQRTDLLVGAPTYALNNTYNLGAVFVYTARKITKAPEFERKIVGKVSGSMFGSAIINVGDLNNDELPEIAIGAPFENEGHGVVYLYSGADLISSLTEWDLKFLQRIEPETSYGESFGMSLTTLQDYGGNGCSELAIGSPYKDSVVLFKCMAAVVVKISVEFPFLKDRTSSNKTDFEFELCLSVKYPSLPKNITALLSTTVEMDHDYAKLAGSNDTGHFSFDTPLDEKKPRYCKNVSFILPLDGKYGKKIVYTITSNLLNDPITLPDFDGSRVILSDRSDLTIQGSLWAAECAGNETCAPNLTLKPFISFRRTDDDPYIIGSSTKETMHITVHNDGEVAYDSCVRVRIDGTHLLKVGGCVYESLTDGDTVMCEPTKPLWNNQTWTTGQIELEMAHLTNLNKTITINIFLYNRCGDDVTQQQSSISIPLKTDHGGIVAKGETDMGSIVNMTKEDIKQNEKQIKHVYTITNKGPTNWKELPVQVTLQMQPFIKFDDTPVTVYFSALNYTPCRFVSQNVTTMTYLCQVESLVTNLEFSKILVPMYIVPETLDRILDKHKNVSIMSSVKIQFIDDDDFKVESIVTTITLQEATVTIPIKRIIIEVVAGLSILIITVLILYMVGFLRRKHRDELKTLKTSVKYQASLRRLKELPHAQAPATQEPSQVQAAQEEAEHDNN